MSSLLLITLQAICAPADTAVVCPREWLPTLQPWIELRQEQGHQLSVITETGSSERIRQRIRRVAENGKLRYVVLVGDTNTDSEVERLGVPTRLIKATVNVQWGSEPEIATDNWYADFDDDRIPDVALGRWTVDTAAELAGVVDKILNYERRKTVHLGQRRIHFVAGGSGFGLLTDMVLENTAKRILTAGIPAQYETSMTYANWRSPYCPNPIEFQRRVIEQLSDDSFAFVYLGHGHRTFLDAVHTPHGYAPVLEADALTTLHCKHPLPLTVLLACYAGAFDGPEECLAERMLRHRQGPVAVIGASRTTMPYGMAVFGTGLLHELFSIQSPKLGDVWLQSKRSMIANTRSGERKMLDSLAKTFSPTPNQLDEECREHLDLFNLLGDPLLTMHYPDQMSVETPRYTQAGQELEIRGTAPFDGQLLLELVCRRDRLKVKTKHRTEFELTEDSLRAMNESHQQANDKRWASQQKDIVTGKFKMVLEVPSDAQGPCHVRAYLFDGNHQHALGAGNVYIRRPSTAQRTTTVRSR